MDKKYSGSCLCGSVRFEIEGNFDSFYLCHCKHCQKDTGSAHAANLFSESAILTWCKGENYVKTYNLPNTLHSKSFCLNCGSALPNKSEKSGFIVVPAGSLDSTLNVRPNAHLFVSSKASWEHHLDSIPSFEKLPSKSNKNI
ncbi:GFA family protein [Desulfuromonas versatilis]|uniref:GFA family protein n=1 Tax=Desulfuromonas versatilis TaxID=2802975 RepID=UPI001C84597D|nr:GFA family protein [Desulfuromonas versatilis]